MNQTIHLQFSDLLMGACLVLAAAGASWLLRLNLQRKVLWASLRMVVQLLLVGFVLRLVFQHASPAITLLVVLVMIAAAAREVAVRPHQRLAGQGNLRIAGLVVALSSLSTVVLALLTAVRPDPWFDARYAIPLMGIVLGSVLNSASLGLDSFFDGVRQSRAAIEAQLACRPPAGQIQLLFEVDRLMGGGWRLQEWRMPDPARLELVANKNNPDARAIVSAWEGSGRFKDVTAEIGRTPGEIKVSATIVRPPAGKKETQR